MCFFFWNINNEKVLQLFYHPKLIFHRHYITICVYKTLIQDIVVGCKDKENHRFEQDGNRLKMFNLLRKRKISYFSYASRREYSFVIKINKLFLLTWSCKVAPFTRQKYLHTANEYDKYEKINIFINILRYKSFFLVFHLQCRKKLGYKKKKIR